MLNSLGKSTRANIIKHSITLFNERGVENVSIETIAKDLGISAGNVNYYFKRKNDLLKTTLDVLKEELGTILQVDEVQTVEDVAQYIIGCGYALWDFRFFFNGITSILADEELRKEYLAFESEIIAGVARDCDNMVKRKIAIKPTAPNSFQLIIESLWNYWLNWQRMQHINNPSDTKPSTEALSDALLHLWGMTHLYVDVRFSQNFHKALQDTLKPIK
jgi:AcrR family transcriptional regulator